MAAEPISITSVSQFDTLLSTTKYVVVDFWAEWCPPCKAIGPIFSKIAATNTAPGKLAFAKVDLEETPDIPERYDVSSIPAFLIFVDGELKGLEGLEGKIKGPAVQTEADGKLRRIVGADPRNLMLLGGELSKLANEDAPEGEASKEETPAAPAAEETKEDKKDERNELFAKDDENW